MREHSYLISDPLCGGCPYIRFTPLIFKDCKKCQDYLRKNLTMEEKPIRIIIENYNGQRITFTMSEGAKIESLFELDKDSIKITHVSINAYDSDILIEKEDLT